MSKGSRSSCATAVKLSLHMMLLVLPPEPTPPVGGGVSIPTERARRGVESLLVPGEAPTALGPAPTGAMCRPIMRGGNGHPRPDAPWGYHNRNFMLAFSEYTRPSAIASKLLVRCPTCCGVRPTRGEKTAGQLIDRHSSNALRFVPVSPLPRDGRAVCHAFTPEGSLGELAAALNDVEK